MLTATTFFANNADAYIYSAGGEKIQLVEDYPDNTLYEEEGEYLDLCVLYKQFWILWIPLWNWEAEYVLATLGSDSYYLITDSKIIKEIEDQHGAPEETISFWNKIGGKITFTLLAVGLIAMRIIRSRES